MISACRSENARIRSGFERLDLFVARVQERRDLRLLARLRRTHGVAGDADDTIALAEQIERLGGLFGQADDSVREHQMQPRSTRRSRSSRSTVEVGKHEAVPVDALAELDADRLGEHRPSIGKRVELAVLAAGIDARPAGRSSSCSIERAAGKRAIELARIDAGQPRLQAAVDHLAREIGGRLRLPDREQRLEPRAGQALLAIAPHVLEKQIAEGDVREAFGDESGDRCPHDRFVLLVRARPGQRHDVQRQAGRRGLRFQQLAPDRVHRDAIERLIGRREQPGGGVRMFLVEHVQHPRGVLAGRPTDENLHLDSLAWPVGLLACHGWSALAIFSMPSTTRGPGTVRPGPLRMITRLFRTAGTDDSVDHGSSTAFRSASFRRFGGVQLEDHVGRAREDHLRADLRRFPVDVGRTRSRRRRRPACRGGSRGRRSRRCCAASRARARRPAASAAAACRRRGS